MSNPMGNMGNMRGPTGRIGNKVPSGYKSGQLQNFTPDQMQLFQQLFGQVSPDSYTSRLAGGDQSSFDQMEAPALRQFNEIQGNISSRFSGQGDGGRQSQGGRHSSGFQNTITSAGSNFAEQLQSNRQQLQRQAIQDLMHMSGSLLGQKPYDNYLLPKKRKPSFLQSLLGGAAPLAGGAIGGYFGGPAGATAGFGIGNSFSQGFLGQGDQY